LLAYFVTIFVAAPAALVTGRSMSLALSTRFRRISRPLSIQTARSLHFLVLVWFLILIVTHVALVFMTGLLNNLNHIYAVGNDDRWIGSTIFAVSIVVVAAGWFALIGPTQRLFEHLDSTPGAYTERDISPYFWHNGARQVQ
jgi:sulfoxide reductase catalytic subunit YedY